MGTRIVFELNESSEINPDAWKNIRKTIQASGGTNLSEPPESPPYILTAVMPNDESAKEMVQKLRNIKGIKQVDLDQLRFAL